MKKYNCPQLLTLKLPQLSLDKANKLMDQKPDESHRQNKGDLHPAGHLDELILGDLPPGVQILRPGPLPLARPHCPGLLPAPADPCVHLVCLV